ncbi:DNA helicase [Batrachochytrium dendrobatidis]|nr:DNA helicase [Batrachochytrium dendrobatidis]KAK5666489.1 DNA helicase [Batrachochytrium dendrobatidis]
MKASSSSHKPSFPESYSRLEAFVQPFEESNFPKQPSQQSATDSSVVMLQHSLPSIGRGIKRAATSTALGPARRHAPVAPLFAPSAIQQSSQVRSTSWDMPAPVHTAPRQINPLISNRAGIQTSKYLSVAYSQKTKANRKTKAATAQTSTSSIETSKQDQFDSLTPEQQKVKDLAIKHGQSLFFTGNAGTGKSFLMKAIINDLFKKYSALKQVAVTASTGISACNIGGCTLHSFAGIGLGNGTKEALFMSAKKNINTRRRWTAVKVLIIDEISMVDGPLFDKIEYIARRFKNNNLPFGGIQLIVSGDFMQLPPVSSNPIFAFEAETWGASVPYTVMLNHVFRQKDPVFVSILNEIRTNTMSKSTIEMLHSLSRTLEYTDGIEPTFIFSTRAEVKRVNDQKLASLNTEEVIFKASFDTKDPAMIKRLLNMTLAQEVVHLKVGAQVMLIKNLTESLVNGSTGIIESFDPVTGFPLVKFETKDKLKSTIMVSSEAWKLEGPDGEVLGCMYQIPLLLSYAMSIHKSQGQTLPRVRVDMSRIFEAGQAYVALSRATSLEGLQVLNFDPKQVMNHEKVLRFQQAIDQLYKAATKNSND